jgi:hypothetical protein
MKQYTGKKIVNRQWQSFELLRRDPWYSSASLVEISRVMLQPKAAVNAVSNERLPNEYEIQALSRILEVLNGKLKKMGSD